jgi:hypothetical protein
MGKVKNLVAEIEQDLYGDWDSTDHLLTLEEIAEKHEVPVDVVEQIHHDLLSRFLNGAE